MLAKKTSKNQLTLPKDIVSEFADIEYFDVSVKGRAIILKPVRITPEGETLDDIRNKLKKLGISEKDVTDAVTWSRKRKS